ncbi:mCG5959, isoform CRA_b [Mus musculus]|nr:mCG5959, isoform CRA_b [Mus musculus]
MPRAGVCGCWGGQVLPLLLAYICYLLLGATIFQLLEKQAEAQSRDQFQLEKLRFLENYTCLDQQALEQFVQLLTASTAFSLQQLGLREQLLLCRHSGHHHRLWKPGPQHGGRAGLLCLLCSDGDPTQCGLPQPSGHRAAGPPDHIGQLLQVLGLALFLTLGTLVILIFPPMFFSHVEGWSFREGFYFAFITLSTIGFGDYVVGTDPSKHYIAVYRSLAAIWILLGLAWLAVVLSLGSLLLHRCSRLWQLIRGLDLKDGAAPDSEPRSQKIPISA